MCEILEFAMLFDYKLCQSRFKYNFLLFLESQSKQKIFFINNNNKKIFEFINNIEILVYFFQNHAVH